MSELKHWAVRLVEAERVIAQQQDHIEHLEQENARLRDELIRVKSARDAYAGALKAKEVKG